MQKPGGGGLIVNCRRAASLYRPGFSPASERSKRSSPSPAFHPVQAICYRSVLMNLRVAHQFHRFASHVFSFTCKLLFSQLDCFQKHLRCPLVFANPARICSRLLTIHYPLLTAFSHAILSHNP